MNNNKNNNNKGVGENQHPLTVSNNKGDKSLVERSIEKWNRGLNQNISDINTIVGSPLHTSYMTDKEASKYHKYGITPTGFETEEKLNRMRAVQQGRLEQFANMLGQSLINEVALGTIKGFSDIFDSIANIGNSDNDYTNALSRQLEDIMESVRNNLAIYQENEDGGFHIGDFAWWMQGAVSAATTVSLMVPGLGITKGLSSLGKVGKIGSKAGKLTRNILKGAKVQDVGRAFNAAKGIREIGTMAFISRTAENYQEARETYKNVYDKALDEIKNMSSQEKDEFIKRNNFENLSEEDIASEIASVSAGETFKNDYWMLLMDIPQFKTLAPIFKGAGILNKATTRSIRKANREAIEKLVGKKLTEEAAEQTSKTFAKRLGSAFTLENLGKGAKNVWKSTEGLMLGEGIEEGFQGIQSERGEEYGEIYFNPYLQRKTLGNYLQDENIWEQAFWGVMGGLLFQGAATGVRKLGNKIEAKLKKDKLTDTEIQALLAGENKSRVSEINGRFDLMDNLLDNLRIIQQGQNPYSPKKDKKGRDVLVNGQRTYDDIKSTEEYEKLKSTAVNDFITNLVLNAADNGNYELLKEFVSNKEFAKYFEDSGVETDQFLEKQFIQKMDEVYNEYTKAYYDIIDNTDAYNEYLTRLAARDITRKKLDINTINERTQSLDEIISENIVNGSEEYERIATQRVINAKLNEIDNAINNINNKLKDKDTLYSKQAYNKELKYLNELKNQLYEQLENVNSDFNYSQYKGTDLEQVFKDIKDLYTNIIGNVLNTTPFEKLSDTLQKSFYAKANYQVYKQELLNDLPNSNNTKDYYKNLYDEKEAMFIDIAESKFTDAYNKVYNYIKRSENPDIALQHLLKDDLESDNTLSDRQKRILNDALELLSIGSYDRQAFNNAIAFMANGEINRRNKDAEEVKESVVDGVKLNEQETKAVNNKPNANVSSTGEKQNKKVNNTSNTEQRLSTSNSPVEGLIDLDDTGTITQDDTVYYPDENTPLVSEFEKQVLEKVALDAEQQQLETGDFAPLIAAENATEKIIKNNTNLWKNVIKDGANSKSYQDFVNLVKEEMIVGQGSSPAVAEQYVEHGIKMYLELANNLDRKYGLTQGEQNLLDVISKILGYDPETGNSLFEGLSEQEALSRKDAYIKEIFDDFVNKHNLSQSNVFGNKFIDIIDVFKEITKLYDDKGISYESILHLYKDIANFVTVYRGNEYVFLNKDFLNVNSTEFINNLYKAKTEVVTVSPFMHFSLSNNFAKNSEDNIKKAINLIQEARDKEVELKLDKNSIYFTYKGTELGFISLAKTDKTNNSITVKQEGIETTLTRSKDGKITSSNDEIFNFILDNENVYKELVSWFIRSNQSLFLSKDNVSVVQQLSKIGSNDTIKYIINSPIVKEFLDRNKINIEGLTDRQAFNFFARNISKILFYDFNGKRISPDTKLSNIVLPNRVKSYVETFKAKQYENFFQTKALQDRLSSGEKVTAILKSDSRGLIRYEVGNDKNINRLGISKETENHPVIFYSESNAVDENGKEYASIPGIGIGSMGIVMGENQGVNYVNNDGTITNTPGANVALITGSNKVNSSTSKLAGQLRNSTHKYLLDSIKKYYNDIAAAKTLSEKNRIYDTLANTLNNLFGQTYSKIFNNIFISKNKDVITILTSLNGENAVIGRIYKYKSLTVENGQRRTKEGKIATDEDLNRYFNGAFEFKLPGEENVDRLFSWEKKGNEDKFSKFIDYILDIAEFNRTYFAKETIGEVNNNKNPHLTKENGKIVLKVGDFRQEFDNFTQMAIKLNMYKTSQIGNRHKYEYPNDKLPDSFFLQINDKVAPVSKEQLKEDKGLLGWIEDNEIQPNDDISTFDVLEEFIPDNVLTQFRNFNNYLRKNTSSTLFTNTIKLNQDLGDSYGRYDNKQILLGSKLSANVTHSKDGWVRLLDVILHENVHRLIDEEKFFDGQEGYDRAKQLQETFDIFYETVKKDKTDTGKRLFNKFEQFYKEYRNVVPTEKLSEEKITKVLANEWIAEVLSHNELREYLNRIQTGEEIIVDNEPQHKSLLQKILDFIVRLFNTNGKINDDTLLAKINQLFSDISQENISSDEIITHREEVSENNESSPVEEYNADNQEIDTDEYGDDTDDDTDFDNVFDSKFVTEDIMLNDFDNDNSVNVFGIYEAPNMENFLQQKPHEKRADLASAISSNELQYVCS